MQRFAFAPEDREADDTSAVLLTVVPHDAPTWEIGPHRHNTGMGLYHEDGRLEITSWWGDIPTFTQEELEAARLAAADAGCVLS